MEQLTEIILTLTPTWLIAIISLVNGILLIYRNKINVHTHCNYTLHSIGILLMGSFYALMAYFTYIEAPHSINYMSLIRFAILWQSYVWLFSSIAAIRENHGN